MIRWRNGVRPRWADFAVIIFASLVNLLFWVFMFSLAVAVVVATFITMAYASVAAYLERKRATIEPTSKD